jgi:hypothetical protein
MNDVSMNHETPGLAVVYGHKMRNETTFFRIGSGEEQRAGT